MENRFADALEKGLAAAEAVTENGAVAFATSGTALVDLNFAASSLRSASEDDIFKAFGKAYAEDPLLAVKWMFMARDCRGGMGERRVFRACFKWLTALAPRVAKELVPLVAEYGRFDDVIWALAQSKPNIVWETAVDYIAMQLSKDMEAERPSLLAKWLPSPNASSPATKALAKRLYKDLGMPEAEYRKALSSIRAKLKVVEAAISANKWGEVDYNAVPSLANLKYKDAFLKHDPDRRREWLKALERGDESAKVNSAVAFPCDIVNKYSKSCKVSYGKYEFTEDPALEAMWKALPDYTSGLGLGSTIVVADSSGSMATAVSGATTALDVAFSLAIYFSEKLTGPFKDKFISFSSRPKYIKLGGAGSLAQKLDACYRSAEVSNTNIKATFGLILSTAVSNRLKQADLPSTVLIVSDMNFDAGTYDYSHNGMQADKKALMSEISREFKAAGYTLPKLVFWNVCGGYGRVGPVPMQVNEAGVTLMSGFSPALAKMAFSAELDPFKALAGFLNSPRYQAVEDAYCKAMEGNYAKN